MVAKTNVPAHARNRTLFVQPAASHFIDRANLPHIKHNDLVDTNPHQDKDLLRPIQTILKVSLFSDCLHPDSKLHMIVLMDKDNLKMSRFAFIF